MTLESTPLQTSTPAPTGFGWSLKVSRPTSQGLDIAVGQEAKVDVTCRLGNKNQTVTVTEAVPLVETTSATLTGNIESSKIADLPLNGRNFVSLLTLRPGFVINRAARGNQSSMGLRPGDSMFLIDGLNMYEWGQGAQLLNGMHLPAMPPRFCPSIPSRTSTFSRIQSGSRVEARRRHQHRIEIRHEFHPRFGLRLGRDGFGMH